MRVFLRAHGEGLARGGVPEPRFLDDGPARLEDADLPVDLEFQRFLEKAERVDVLHLGFRAERGLSARTHRDVRVAAQAALLHVAVVHAERHQNLPQPAERVGGILGGAQIGMRHDLDEWRAAAVEVDVRVAMRIRESFMQRLPRIFLHVDANDPDAPRLPRARILEGAFGRQRLLILRNLITLRQIGIEIVLPRENRPLLHRAGQRQRGLDRKIDRSPVQDGQGAGQAQAHRTDIGVRPIAKSCAATAKNLGLGEQAGMDFEPDDRLEPHGSAFHGEG